MAFRTIKRLPVKGSDIVFSVMLDKDAQARQDPGCYVVVRNDYPFDLGHGEHFPTEAEAMTNMTRRHARTEELVATTLTIKR